ncbi:MAG: hypothetical protein Kow0029_05060 [Candidatus Rifleibacteriota bacterium]
MKKNSALFLLLILILAAQYPADAWRKWEFINPPDLEIKAWPDKKEIIAGEIATFTIQIRNKTDKTINIFYPTGQRWDYAIYHNGTQIYRWSQGLKWEEAPHSIPLRVGEPITTKMAWRSTDRLGYPLPVGDYRFQGMVMVKPRYLVSNTCTIRLLPPEVKKRETVTAPLNSFFEIEVPRYSGKKELVWQIMYEYNDNRIAVHKVTKKGNKLIITFKAKRTGHVNFDLYARIDTASFGESIERRSYRVEIK